ncbi:hypothetical protein [Halobacteriovorax marinus]|uniref:hypothetical protein n=1 Tax=Halobacteriovorax marinus TaxID=97084 RepID=UPI003A906C53
MNKLLTATFILFISLTAFGKVSLDSFNARVISFCRMESKDALKGQDIILTKQVKAKSCIDAQGLITEIDPILLDIYGYPRVEVIEKSLGKLCSLHGVRKWRSRKLMAYSAEFELPEDPCVCDMVNNFDETKKSICSSDDDKHPIKQHIQESANKILITNSIQLEREAEHLLDMMRYYGIEEGLCEEEIEPKCEGVEEAYSEIDLDINEENKMFSFLKEKQFNPISYLKSLKKKKGSFYQPKLELNSHHLQAHIEKMTKKFSHIDLSKIGRIESSSALQDLIGKPSHQYMMDMHALRLDVKENGNSLEGFIKNELALEDSGKIMKSLCKFSDSDSDTVKELKMKILTHESLSRFSCADNEKEDQIEKKSKALADLINKSSKNVDTEPFLANALKSEFRDEFAKEVSKRCENLSKRVNLICSIPTMEVHGLVEEANRTNDSASQNALFQLAENSQSNAVRGLSFDDNLSCLMGPKPAGMGALGAVDTAPIDMKAPPTTSEIDRTVEEQKALHTEKMAELAFVESVRDRVRDYARDVGIKEGTPEFKELTDSYENLIPESLEGKIRVGMSDEDFAKAKQNFVRSADKYRDEKLNKIQNSLVRRYGRLASRPNGKNIFARELGALKREIDEVTRITGRKPAKQFVDRYFSSEPDSFQSSPSYSSKTNSSFIVPETSVGFSGVNSDEYGDEEVDSTSSDKGSNGLDTSSSSAQVSSSKKGAGAAASAGSRAGVSGARSAGGGRGNSRGLASVPSGVSLTVQNDKDLVAKLGDFEKEVSGNGFGIIYISERKVFKKVVDEKFDGAEWPREMTLKEFDNNAVSEFNLTQAERDLMNELLLKERRKHSDLKNIFDGVTRN